MSANSSVLGLRSCSCSNLMIALDILLTALTWLSGRRTRRLCSAKACRMVCLIHHTAYEMNLNPRVSSNFSAALMSPMLPSLMRSGNVSPWFWYCLATLTTKRRLASTSLSKAALSPLRMRWVSSTSSSTVIKFSRPISWRYFSKASPSRAVILLLILSCLMLSLYCM